MRATVLLCDNAQEANGKLYVLGVGWNLTGPAPVTFGIGVMVFVTASDLGVTHTLRLSIVDDAGQLAMINTPKGDLPALDVVQAFIIRADEQPVLTDIAAIFAINLASIPFASGVYSVVVNVNGKPTEGGYAGFAVRQPGVLPLLQPRPTI